MEARLLPFVLDVYLSGSLVVEQHLSENQFEIILVHVIARARNLIISHVREIEGRAVTMTTLRDGVNVSAPLQVLDIFLRTQYGGDIETVMGQAVALQYIRPFGADGIQLALGGGDEIGNGVAETINDIVIVRLDLHETLAHRCGILPVLRRTWQTDTTRYVMLLRLQIVEFDFIAECPPGISHKVILDDLRLFLLMRAAHEEQHT